VLSVDTLQDYRLLQIIPMEALALYLTQALKTLEIVCFKTPTEFGLQKQISQQLVSGFLECIKQQHNNHTPIGR